MDGDDKIRISWDDIAAKSSPANPAPPPRGPQEPKPAPPAADARKAAAAPPPIRRQPARTAPELHADGRVDTIQRDLPQIMTANKRVAGQLCAICQSKIAVGDEVRNCEKCLLSYHLECWNENKGCATYGCPNAPGKESQLGQPEIRVDFGSGPRAPLRTPTVPTGSAGAPSAVAGRKRPVVEFGSALCPCGTLIPPGVLHCQSCGQPRPGAMPGADIGGPDQRPIPPSSLPNMARYSSATARHTSREGLRVGVGPRAAALFLDGICVFIATLIFGYFAGGSRLVAAFMQGMGQYGGRIDPGKDALVGILYCLIEGLTGASPGKRILGLVVAYPDGTFADVRLWIKRACLKYSASLLGALVLITGLTELESVGNLVSLIVLLGCLGAFGASRLALHDIIAGSAVFYRRDTQ